MTEITEAQRLQAAHRAQDRSEPDTSIGEDEQNVVIDGVRICHDCLHFDESHSIPDPNNSLSYGMGNCGNCTECQA